MRYLLTLVMLLSSLSLLATEPTDVSMMNLNGPVKSYSKDRETFYFDKSGYLTEAKLSTKVDLIYSWREYYEHKFDKKGRRIKTMVYGDSTRKNLKHHIKYIYNKDGLITGAKKGDSYNSYNITPYWKLVLAKYGSKKHTPNSVLKKKHRTIVGRRFKRKIITDSVYCYYNENGDLYLFRSIDRYGGINEVSFVGDTLSKIINPQENSKLIVVFNSQGEILELKDTTKSDSISGVRIENNKYNAAGLLEEKREYRKNYCNFYAWTIHNIDCVISYKYDQFNNLVGEECKYNDGKETQYKNYEIEYYEK